MAFDIISVPKRILITGSEADYKLALGMVAEKKEVSQDGSVVEDCAICWTPAEHAVVTRCKHTYCADCFERFCFNGASGAGEFSIGCEGDSGKCGAAPALDELQEHLSSTTFEDLLEASFASYIRLHPQDFRYCPTPDCNQVYRATTSAGVFSCASCLAAVCTCCHVSHHGMTCAEHKDMASGGYEALALTKKRLGIKDCPKCSTAIEKTEGCNHMTCGGCQTHICWVCMETFTASRPCYDHMNKKHGSIGLEY